MYKFKMDRPSMPPGTEVLINGLGVVRNGHEMIIDDDLAENFRQANSRQVTEQIGPDKHTTVTETVKGPTLLQAFQGDPTVEVSVYKESESKKKATTLETQETPTGDDNTPADDDAKDGE